MRYMVIGGITSSNVNIEEKEHFQSTCVSLGRALSALGHSLVVCSPFKDSADFWVFNGFVQGDFQDKGSIEFHFVDTSLVRTEINNLESNAKSYRFVKIPHPPPNDEEKQSFEYAWLLCQLHALESCQAIIAIGGKPNGAANMLLLLAETKRKQLLPFSFMDGAASQSFYRRQYELRDRFGDAYLLLQDERKFLEILNLSEKILTSNPNQVSAGQDLNFFISYARTRPSEADYIETILRRRNLHVFRDESEFGAGHAIPSEITEAIHAANIFIAIWCAEYACSPWCFDELELALDRNDAGKINLWIICVEFGETPQQCLQREIREELDVDIEVSDFFAESIYTYQSGTIKLMAYWCRWLSGEFNLKVHSKLAWVNCRELDLFDFAPADIPLVEKLKEVMC